MLSYTHTNSSWICFMSDSRFRAQQVTYEIPTRPIKMHQNFSNTFKNRCLTNQFETIKPKPIRPIYCSVPKPAVQLHHSHGQSIGNRRSAFVEIKKSPFPSFEKDYQSNRRTHNIVAVNFTSQA